MDPTRIEIVETRSSVSYADFVDRYAFRADKKWHHLQKLCLWVLKKIGAHAQHTEIDYHRRVIDTHKLLDAIALQRSEALRMLPGGTPPRHIIIGSSTYADLMCEPEILRYTSLAAVFMNRKRELMGLQIEIVPWINGCIVLPELRK